MSTLASEPTRILLVEDHAIMSAGLRLLLESRSNLMVSGEASNREDALAAAAREQPDIILLDVMLGGDNSLDFFPDLCAAAPGARVLVLTGVMDPEIHRRALLLGAMGLVLKEQASQVLLKAIERVQAGEIWFERAMMANALVSMSHTPTAKESDETARIALLTEREREVVVLIGERLKNREIAARLFITEATVRHHLTSIFQKLEVSDRLELMIYAYEHGLAQQPR